MPSLDFAFVCDYARQDAGPVHALAIGIDTVYAPDVPWGQNLGVVARFTFTRNECGRPHRVELIAQDEDGQRLVHLTGTLEPQWDEGLPPGWSVGAMLTLNFGLPLPQFGLYAIEILLNDSSVKTLSLRVMPPTAGPSVG